MQYRYAARTKTGESQEGVVEASSYSAALDTLHRAGLVVISLEELSQLRILQAISGFFQRVKVKEVVVFSRQLATLFEASVPLVESLRTLAAQADNAYLREVLTGVADDVDAGTQFSQALAKFPRIFSPFYVSMVESGEVSGKLQDALEFLAAHEEKEYALRQKVRGALVYPAVVVGVFILVGVLMMVYVVPNLTTILKDFGGELPLPTRVLIFTSEALRRWGLALLGLAVAAVFGLRRYLRTGAGKNLFDRLLLRLPVLGEMFRKIYIARFAENLSTLIKGGLPIIRSLEITANVVGNAVFGALIRRAMEEVKGGSTISSVLAKDPQVPPMVAQMIAVGERSGKIDAILVSLSRFYAREVDAMVANLTTLIEPFIIVFLGGAVAALVASILLPIYNIATGVS